MVVTELSLVEQQISAKILGSQTPKTRGEREWQRFASRIQAGICVCKRNLVRGLCSLEQGGCGKPPLALKVKSTSWCQCVPYVAGHSTQNLDQMEWAASPKNAAIVQLAEGQQEIVPWQAMMPRPMHTLQLPVRCFLAEVAANQHVTIIAFGDPGKGKSYSMMSMLEDADPTFTLDRVIYSRQELMYWTFPGRLKKGHALLIDEGGPLMSNKRSLSQMNQFLSELFQTFRQDCAIIAVCVPRARYIELGVRELVKFHIHAVGVDMVRKYSITEISRIMNVRNPLSGEEEMRYALLTPGAARRYGWRLPKRIDLVAYEAKKLKARQDNHTYWVETMLKKEKKEAASSVRGKRMKWEADDDE